MDARIEYGKALVLGLRELARRWWQCEVWAREAYAQGQAHTGAAYYRHAEAITHQKGIVREEFARCCIDRLEVARLC